MKNISENIYSKSGVKLFASLACLLAVIALQGCGGNGAGAAGGAATATGSSISVDAFSLKAKSVTVLSSQPNLPSDGKTTAALTIIVKDDGNRALENATVDLSTTDAGSVIQFDSKKTGPDGTIKATLISTGKSNRVIPIVAIVGTNKTTFDIAVSGTSLTLSGPQAITATKSGEYTLSLRDSAGTAFPNMPVVLTSLAGNTFSPAQVVTDSNGQAKFAVTATKGGTDTISVSSAGASGSIAITIASSQLEMTNVVSNEEVLVGQSKTVSLKLTNASGPVANQTIFVSSTRGNVVPSAGSVTTDGSGSATFTVNSPTAGISTLNVSGPGGTSANANVEFVSKTPSSISLQPSKQIISANPAGSAGNNSSLLATVRDATGNPVKGVRVNFSADLDPSNGLIEPGYAITDSAGLASVAFVAGASASGPNGIILKASVAGSGPVVSANSSLTVTNGGISIRIGTGNRLAEDERKIRYEAYWTALVVDSAGKPIVNAPVAIQVVPLEYYKGEWAKSPVIGGDLQWGRKSGYTVCDSEDGIADLVTGIKDPTRLDGVLQASAEDVNGNGRLDPGNVASSSFFGTTNTTDSSGFADFKITYAKSYARFVKVRIDVKTQVSGSEASVSESFVLNITAEDAILSAPPGALDSAGVYAGPFGKATTCTNPN
jgi:Bacterial Ig-like domain (group 1)